MEYIGPVAQIFLWGNESKVSHLYAMPELSQYTRFHADGKIYITCLIVSCICSPKWGTLFQQKVQEYGGGVVHFALSVGDFAGSRGTVKASPSGL